MQSHSDARAGGFVLMEALVALTIIGLAAIGLLAATAAQVRTADKAVQLLTARSLAEERMAMLRVLTYDDMNDLPDSLAAGRFPEPFQEYAWRAEIAPADGEYDLFSAAVAVTINGEEFPLRTLIHVAEPFQLTAEQ